MSWTHLPYQVGNFYYNRTYQVYTKIYEAVAAAVAAATTVALSIRGIIASVDPEGPPPPRNLKNIGFHSNIGPGPL